MSKKILTITDNIRIRKQTSEESDKHFCNGCIFNGNPCTHTTYCDLDYGVCKTEAYYVYEDCTKKIRKEKIERIFND